MRKLFTLCAVLLLVSAVAYAQTSKEFTAQVKVLPYLLTYDISSFTMPDGHSLTEPGDSDTYQAIFHRKIAYCNHYVDISLNLQPFWRAELKNPGEGGPTYYDWLYTKFSQVVFYWGNWDVQSAKSYGPFEPAYPGVNPTTEPVGTEFALDNSGSYVAHDGLIFMTLAWNYSSQPISTNGNTHDISDDAGLYKSKTVITYTLHSFAN